MIFPLLFAAGMSLIDTIDSILMVQAYGWTLTKPFRKLYYNLTITGMSVAVALAIGGVELLGLLRDRLNLSGRFWGMVGLANDNLGGLGYLVIALFAASWAISVAIYRLRNYDRIELEAVK
jgi:high-affinity nickel-transport protein